MTVQLETLYEASILWGELSNLRYIMPTSEWIESLNVGEKVLEVTTPNIGDDPLIKEVKIKSISKTGIISVEGSAHTFKDGYRRGFQYSGNCWLQPLS